VAVFASAHARVLESIHDAAARAGRDPRSIALVGVSKTVPATRLAAAVAAGLTTLGENRVQEAETKRASVAGVTWHLVGPLQSNKARRAIETFALIETVDSVGLAERLDGLARSTLGGRSLAVLLQVNVDRDPAKAGFQPGSLQAAAAALDRCSALDVRGLMTVGRQVQDPHAARSTFIALRELSERLRADWPRLGPELSMGMSDDFPIAVEEGATIVRVGTALFGERRAP